MFGKNEEKRILASLDVAEVSEEYGFWNAVLQTGDWILNRAPAYFTVAVATSAFYVLLEVLRRGLTANNPINRSLRNIQQNLEIVNPGLQGLIRGSSDLFPPRRDEGTTLVTRVLSGTRQLVNGWTFGLSDAVLNLITFVVDQVTGPEFSPARIDFPPTTAVNTASLQRANTQVLLRAAVRRGTERINSLVLNPPDVSRFITRLPN